MASDWHLDAPWPKESDFSRAISCTNSLFIFIKILVLALEHRADPNESLKSALQDSARTGLESLYRLYCSILKAQVVHNNSEFQWMIGVLVAAALY